MAISLSAVLARHEQRIRVMFSAPVDTGAFGMAPSLYTIENQDGLGVSPTVSAAMVVTGSPATVELALSTPLVGGALYKVSAIGVPGLDASVTPAGSFEMMRYGAAVAVIDKEPATRDRELLLYGRDLIWSGQDFREAANGDLDQVSGTPNVTKALFRGLTSNGLPHDSTWGAKARDYVDSPTGAAGTLKGAVLAQGLRDPRVESVKVDIEVSGSNTYLHLVPVLISGEKISRVTLTVPT